MSAPARTLRDPPHERAPTPRPAKPSRRPKAPGRHPGTKARRGQRGLAAFVVLSSAVVAVMILGLVTMNALLAQSSFWVDDLAERVSTLTEHYERLRFQKATLSAPDRIAAWARKHGMRLPDEIHILHVPAAGSAAPVGESDAAGRSVEPTVAGEERP